MYITNEVSPIETKQGQLETQLKREPEEQIPDNVPNELPDTTNVDAPGDNQDLPVDGQGTAIDANQVDNYFIEGEYEQESLDNRPKEYQYKYFQTGPPRGVLVSTNPRLAHINRKYGPGRILQFWFATNRYKEKYANNRVALSGPDLLKIVKDSERADLNIAEGMGPSGGGRLGIGRPSLRQFEHCMAANPLERGLETAIRCLRILELPSVQSISLGPSHALLLTGPLSGGLVYSAGSNSHGQLGILPYLDRNDSLGIRPYFTLVSSLNGDCPIEQVSCGYNFSLCVASSGSVFAWGAGQGYGISSERPDDAQLRPGPTLAYHNSMSIMDAPLPQRVRLPGPGIQPPSYLQPSSGTLPVHGACQIAAGYAHSLLLESSAGAVWSWGQNV
jgi:hypothetical protein